MLFKNRKGTSLIEAAISIALIGIMLLWAAKIYSNSLKNTATTSDMEIATHLASDRIEYLKTLTKDGIKNELTNHKEPQTFPAPYNDYEYKYIGHGHQVNNNNNDDDGTVWLKDIEVDVYKKGETVPLIKMECNFLRENKSDGKNLGV